MVVKCAEIPASDVESVKKKQNTKNFGVNLISSAYSM